MAAVKRMKTYSSNLVEAVYTYRSVVDYDVQWLEGKNNLNEEFNQRLNEECRKGKRVHNDVNEFWINVINTIKVTTEQVLGIRDCLH